MKSKDVKALTREELAQKFNEALKSEDPEKVAQAMADMAFRARFLNARRAWRMLSSLTRRHWRQEDFAS